MAPVAWLSVCEIELPEPFDSPEMYGANTVHANVVPLILLGLVMVTDAIAWPEQMLCDEGLADTVGSGFTVTVASMEEPVQPLAEGVIVYVAV